jgi:hypothetical protein
MRCTARQVSSGPDGFGVEYWCIAGKSSAPRVGCTDPAASNYEPVPDFQASCRYARARFEQTGLGPANQTAGVVADQKVRVRLSA